MPLEPSVRVLGERHDDNDDDGANPNNDLELVGVDDTDGVGFDLRNQRVIRADIARTFGDMPLFQSKQTRHDMEWVMV